MELPMRVSTATDPSKVFSDKYVGPSYDSYPLDFFVGKPGDRSMMHIFPSPSYGFLNPSSVQRWPDLVSFSYDPHRVLENGQTTHYVVCTANKKFAVTADNMPQYGAIYNPDEFEMAGWLAATQNSKAVEIVSLPEKSQGLIRLPEKRRNYSQYGMTDVNLYVSEMFPLGEMRFNDVGIELSRLRNEEDRFRNFLFYNNLHERPSFEPGVGYHPFNQRTFEFAKRLDAEGIEKPRDLEAFGTGDLTHQNALAATYFRKFLVVERELHRRILKEAQDLGLSESRTREYVQKRHNSIMEHEAYHFLEPEDIVPEWFTESRIGLIHAKHYEEMAALEDSDIDAILSQIYADYAEYWSAGRERSRYYRKSRTETHDAGETCKNAESSLEGMVGGSEGKYAVLRSINGETGEVREYNRNELERAESKSLEGSSQKTYEGDSGENYPGTNYFSETELKDGADMEQGPMSGLEEAANESEAA